MSDNEGSPPTAKRSRQTEPEDSSPSEDLNEPPTPKDINMELFTIPTSQPSAIEEVLANAREAVLKVTKAIDETNKMRDDAHLAINQAFKTLQQELELRKATLFSELESVSLSKKIALTHQKEKFEKFVAASEILLTHNDETAALEVLLEKTEVLMIKNMEPTSLVSNIYSDIHVVLPTDNLVRELYKFGYILDSSLSPSSSTWTSKSVAKVKRCFYLNVETKTLKGTVYPHGGVQVKAEMICSDGVVVHGEVEDHMDGTYTITLIPQTTGPHQLLITLNGQHVQNSPHDLSVLHCLDKKQVIKCPKAPSGIAIHDNGDLYVATACSCIYAFDATGHPKESVGDCELNNGLVFQDEKLSVRSSLTINNNQLYFAGIGKKCVKQLNLDGKGIKVFSHNEASGVLADDECYRIYLSDCNDNKINVLNHNGDAISTIDGNVEHEGEHDFNSPYGLALDPLGNIHVAASGSNTIKVFTKEGVYIRKYGDLIDPRGIAIDEEGYSFVTEFEGKCISMFDPEGNKIHTMGVIGKPFSSCTGFENK